MQDLSVPPSPLSRLKLGVHSERVCCCSFSCANPFLFVHIRFVVRYILGESCSEGVCLVPCPSFPRSVRRCRACSFISFPSPSSPSIFVSPLCNLLLASVSMSFYREYVCGVTKARYVADRFMCDDEIIIRRINELINQ